MRKNIVVDIIENGELTPTLELGSFQSNIGKEIQQGLSNASFMKTNYFLSTLKMYNEYKETIIIQNKMLKKTLTESMFFRG